ncbi:MAG TPA: ACT domain-containing protein [Kofleriaceae bacterium]|nr:ACT domain-containing protein [Kofleriaceae bacterium]
MRDSLVLTVVGPDRTGLVEALAAQISAAGGNWEASHMARLAGQFAGILLVTIAPDATGTLLSALKALDAHGLAVTIHAAGDAADVPSTHTAFLELTGDDRVGIVRDVARVLAARGVNVEELESEVTSAPMSGEALFTARAVLRIPAEHSLALVRADLEALASELMVDLAASDELDD